MKKLLAILLTVAMVMGLAACTPATPTTEAPVETTTQAPTTPEQTTTAPTTTEPTTEEPTTEEPKPQVISYDEFVALPLESEVVIEAWIQLVAYNAEYGNADLFLADEDGAYFVYRMVVTPEEAALLEEGKKIRITGFKAEWSGEVEITDAKFEVAEGETEKYKSVALNISALPKDDDLATLMNRRIALSSAVVLPSVSKAGEESPFLYDYNGTGEDGDNLYFNVKVGKQEYTLVVDRDEFGAGTEVYEAVKQLSVGDVIDLEGFLYWYEGPQPHIIEIRPADALQKSEGVMDYTAYCEAAKDSQVVIEAFVQLATYKPDEQDKDKGTMDIFLADLEGAYYVYHMNVTAEEAAMLTPGALIRVEGFKSDWKGEIEIADGKFERMVGFYLADPVDVTDFFGDEETLATFMNRLVQASGATVLPSIDEVSGEEAAFLYKNNGSGTEGDDLYFTLSLQGREYKVLVESDEFGPGTEIYEAVKQLSIGDVIDLEGFLYWYNGPQPHVTGISVSDKPSDVSMDYKSFLAAEMDSQVKVEGYIQLVSSYKPSEQEEEKGTVNLFLAASGGGAYFIYGMPVTAEEAEALSVGTRIRVIGYKKAWAGEIEIMDVESFETLSGEYISEPIDITMSMDDEYLETIMNNRVKMQKAIVMPSDGNAAFLYNYNGSGESGDDIYFKVSVMGRTITVVVESEEFGADSEVYQAVEALQIGDVIDIEAFMYWYEGPQPHVVSVNGDAYMKETEDAMSYGNYLMAEAGEEVTVEAWVQLAGYNAEYGNVSLFLADEAGYYYVYHMPVTPEEAEKLERGAKVLIKGYKAEWSGLREINGEDVKSFEILEGTAYYAEEIPWSALSGRPELQNALQCAPVLIKRAVILPSLNEVSGEEEAFLYKYNGTGEEGDDIYFRVLIDGEELTLVVENDEFGPDTDLYKMVQNQSIGNEVDILAYLYWYEGPQPHVYQMFDNNYMKEDGVLTHREYLAAEEEEEVTVEGAIQLVTAYNEEYGNCSLYLDDYAGAYFVYRLALTQEEYENLKVGTWIRISGFKKTWSGQVEITDATYDKVEFLDPGDLRYEPYVSVAMNVADKLGSDGLEAYMNRRIQLQKAEVIASVVRSSAGEVIGEYVIMYKDNNSGEPGDDIYFTVQMGEETLVLIVETDEWPADSQVYKAVQELKIGNTIDLEAFLYWYEGPQPHVQWISVITEE